MQMIIMQGLSCICKGLSCICKGFCYQDVYATYYQDVYAKKCTVYVTFKHYTNSSHIVTVNREIKHT